MSLYANSKIPRRARTVPVQAGELFGSVYSSVTSRMTEIDALQRMVYGDTITATNNKIYDPESLLCSCCGQRKHLTQFHRDARYTWRQSRRYECSQCEKLNVVDQKARRAKRLARQKAVA
jgi:hypothetical protein